LLFLGEKKPDWAKLFKDKDWVVKLAYLSDIFFIANYLKTSLQGQMVSVFRMADKIAGFKRKLEIWEGRIPKKCFNVS
jgi:hypothetical protein